MGREGRMEVGRVWCELCWLGGLVFVLVGWVFGFLGLVVGLVFVLFFCGGVLVFGYRCGVGVFGLFVCLGGGELGFG